MPNSPHRRQARQRERQEAAGVDQRGEHDRVTGHAHGVDERLLGRRPVAAPFLEVVEEVDLVVLGGPEHRRGDEDGGDVEADPVTRMNRNITRMAKSDGTIAISRAGPLRKTTRKVTKMSAEGEREAVGERRHELRG